MSVFGQSRVNAPAYVIGVLFTLLATVALAVEPDEILPDPAQESRARDISAGLRCLVCQNESIDESHASLARDLRFLVRERIVAGDTDEQVVSFIVDRYGEFVLLKPTTGGWNWMLWATGPVLFLLAFAMAAIYVRRRASAAPVTEEGLSEEERKRLEEILKG